MIVTGYENIFMKTNRNLSFCKFCQAMWAVWTYLAH